MMILQVQDVARQFGGVNLFQHVNLGIQHTSRIGLVGVNGVGKSTLLKIIAGINAPDEGQVVMNRNLTMGYLAQNSGLDSTQTVWSEMLTAFDDVRKLGITLHELEVAISQAPEDNTLLKRYDQVSHEFKEQNGYGYEAEIRSVLHGFQFYPDDFDKQIATLSGGERSRLAMAKMLLQHFDLLILDEPTNHLDIETLNWLEGYLQNYDGALLIVSHDQYFLDHVVNEIYELAHHSSQHYQGNYSHYLQERTVRQQQAEKAYSKQQAEIEKLETFVQKNITRKSTTKRAQSRRKQLEKMERLDRPEGEDPQAHFHFPIATTTGQEVLNVHDLAVGYSPNHVMASPIDFQLRKGERLAIIGPNGVGKSTLLKTLLQLIPCLGGDFQFGAHVDYGYYDQNQDQLDPQLTVLDTIWNEHPMTAEKDIRSVLGSFLFRGDDVQKMVHQLSGGEKARLLLTKLAMEHHNVLIMDEPTNHLDIQSKEVLEQALADYEGTLLFVSHDRYFINHLADKIIVVSPNGSTLYEGNYDHYLEKRATDVVQESTPTSVTTDDVPKNAALDFKQQKEQQRQQRKLQRQADQLEAELTDLNQQLDAITTQMADPETSTHYSKMMELQQEADDLQEKIATTETSWLTLAEELDTTD